MFQPVSRWPGGSPVTSCECPCVSSKQTAGPNQLLVDLTDPNRPRFTMQELKEVLQERNQLKAQLMVAQEELQLFKR